MPAHAMSLPTTRRTPKAVRADRSEPYRGSGAGALPRETPWGPVHDADRYRPGSAVAPGGRDPAAQLRGQRLPHLAASTSSSVAYWSLLVAGGVVNFCSDRYWSFSARSRPRPRHAADNTVTSRRLRWLRPTVSTPGARPCSGAASGGSPMPASTCTSMLVTPVGGAPGRWPSAFCEPASRTPRASRSTSPGPGAAVDGQQPVRAGSGPPARRGRRWAAPETVRHLR
jgi:hypothetical protein